jgi:Nucleotidyl transferase AbiEii toxin, Type IV TA system
VKGKRPRQVVTQRQETIRAAHAARISPAELDRAKILAQIAAHLASHRQIRGRIAFKGGAIMHLIDNSPRHSGDLDGVVISGRALQQRWIDEALWDNPLAARTFIARPRLVNANETSLVYPIIECRAIGSGQNPITVKMSISWAEPLLLDPVWCELSVHGFQDVVRVPTVDPRERNAEKVRAFLERASVNDAYDLDQFAGRGYSREDWNEVRRLIPLKVQHSIDQSRIAAGTNLSDLFDLRLAEVEAGWPGSLIVQGEIPEWGRVEPGVRRFRNLLT